MSAHWMYCRTPHPIMGGFTIAEDDETLIIEQRGTPYLIRRESGNGYALPLPLPQVEEQELLAWAKGVTIRAMLN